MAVPVKPFVIMIICSFITDVLCYNVMPKPKDCKNKISGRQCQQIFKTKYKGNINDMCFGDKAMDDCCEFCFDRLTCDIYDPNKSDIIDLQIKFNYMTVDCKNTMRYSQCMDVRNKGYNKDTKAMCKDEKYAGMCCTFCKYNMGKDWNNLYIDDWLKHPYKQVQNILDNYDLGDYGGNGGGNGGDYSGNRGFGDNIGNIVDGIGKGFGNDGKGDIGFANGIANNMLKNFGGNMDLERAKLAPNVMSNQWAKKIFDNVDSMSSIQDMNVNDAPLRNRRDSSEDKNVCEDRIDESTCQKMMMSKFFKHGGMPHIFCADPHNMASCCQFCASAQAKGLANRAQRNLAFKGEGDYPEDDDVEPCEGDKLSQNDCNQILYSEFKGSKREMCSSIHFGNVCCGSCKRYFKQ